MEHKEVKCPEYGIVLKEQNPESGHYYADILPEYDKPEIDIPEEVNGMKITGLKCLNDFHHAVRMIRLSRAVEFVHFGFGKLSGRFLEIEIDKENPYIFTDGWAIYTKNGELTLFFAGGCTRYEVLAGTRVIRNSAFCQAPNLRHLKLPRGVEVIDVNAFSRMTALRDINIPDGVRVLGSNAFFGCNKLETLHIPKSVEEIGNFAFPKAGAFREITVDADNPHFAAENGVLYSKDKTRLISAPPKAAGKCFTVPDFVNTIGFGAFHSSPDLEEVILPPSVSAIEQSAFNSCRSLRRINLENVKRIVYLAFENCSQLTSVELFCEELGLNAFRSCHRLKTVAVNGLKKSGRVPLPENLHELILPDDLDPTLLSYILFDYRNNPYVIAVRGHETREILYKLSGMCDNRADLLNLTGNFGAEGFCFESYDRYFEERFGGSDFVFDMTKVYTSFLRLKYPRGLSEHAREVYLNVLSAEAEYALDTAIRANNIAALPDCFDIGMINAGNIIALINHSAKLHAAEFTALLLELKNKRFPNLTDDLILE